MRLIWEPIIIGGIFLLVLFGNLAFGIQLAEHRESNGACVSLNEEDTSLNLGFYADHMTCCLAFCIQIASDKNWDAEWLGSVLSVQNAFRYFVCTVFVLF